MTTPVADDCRSMPVAFPSAADRPAPIRGRLRTPPAGSARTGSAVLCHPHPDFGGSMDVWLLPLLGHVLASDGWTVLRFDFAEAGRHPAAPVSEVPGSGLPDHAGERADLAGAIAFLRSGGHAEPGERLAVVGWSFGALVALLHGLDEPAVTDWVGIAPPTVPLPGLPMAPVPTDQVARWSARRVVVAGHHDQFFPPAHLGLLVPHERHVLADSDHFFFDHDREVAELVRDALRRGDRRRVGP